MRTRRKSNWSISILLHYLCFLLWFSHFLHKQKSDYQTLRNCNTNNNNNGVKSVLVSLVPLFLRCVDARENNRRKPSAWRHSCVSPECDVNDRWRQTKKTKFGTETDTDVGPFFFPFHRHQPVIIEKNYSKLYRIIFICLAFPRRVLASELKLRFHS